jgi:hypothetical protein
MQTRKEKSRLIYFQPAPFQRQLNEYRGGNCVHQVHSSHLKPRIHVWTNHLALAIEVLDSPLKCLVKSEYIGPENGHIVAWSHKDHPVATALACSMRNSSIGEIPVDCLDLEMSKPHPFGIYIARSNQKVSQWWDLSWEEGQHIKVYMWRDPKTKIDGFGLNLVATGQVGAFRVRGYGLQPVWFLQLKGFTRSLL